jgi:hypothetical protein
MRWPWRRKQAEPVSHDEAVRLLHDQERVQRSLNNVDEPIGDSAKDLSNAVDLWIAGGGAP